MWGVLAGVVAANILGSVWYNPLLFGNLWLEAAFPKHTREMLMAERTSAIYIISLVSSVATALLLNFILIYFFNVKTVLEGVKFAGGLVSLATLIDVPHLVFSHRSLLAFIIDHLYDAVTVMAMAACVTYFS